MPAEYDHLGRQLSDLEGDVAHVRMPGPDAARRRARQRARNQTTGAALGAVAAAATALLLIVQPTISTAPTPPAGNPSGSPTALPTAVPTPRPSEQAADDRVTTSDLLEAADLRPLDHMRWTEDERVPEADLGYCADLPDDELIRWFTPAEPFDPLPFPGAEGDEVWTAAVQSVQTYADEDEADAAFRAFRAAYRQCAAGLRVRSEFEAPGIGDQAYVAVFGVPVEGEDEFGRELAISVSRTGSVVTRVIRQVATQEPGPGGNLVASDLAAAVTRLCATPAGGACAGRPELRRIPENTSAPPGYIAPDDAGQTLASGPWEILVTPQYLGESVSAHACATFDEPAGVEKLHYSIGVLPTDEQVPTHEVTQQMLLFPDETSAAQAEEQIADGFDSCEQDQSQLDVSPVTGRATDSVTDLVWRIETSAGEPQWWAVVRSGQAVSLVDVIVPASGQVSDEQVLELVDLAQQRLSELG